MAQMRGASGRRRGDAIVVTSASIACGGHAGDAETMFRTVTEAHKRGAVLGADPGYADPAGFSRGVIPMFPGEVGRIVAAQVGALACVAVLAARVRYVNSHGALGNLAADDRAVSDAIVTAVAALPGHPAILAISGTELEMSARAAGVPLFSEMLADRADLSNGRYVPRTRPGAVPCDANEASERLIAPQVNPDMPTAGAAASPRSRRLPQGHFVQRRRLNLSQPCGGAEWVCQAERLCRSTGPPEVSDKVAASAIASAATPSASVMGKGLDAATAATKAAHSAR